jgi:Lrp/AsnC family transcriptional regulator for asnA, asnC and gidA
MFSHRGASRLEVVVDRLDARDQQIIRLLQGDGRMAFSELARAVGVSQRTVRRRVERLLSEGIIQIVACVSPPHVGYGFAALVYVHADLDKLIQIAQQLAAIPEIREVIYTSGNFELVVRLALPSSDDLLPFLTERIAPIPGIKTIQTATVLQVEKSIHCWSLPEVATVPLPVSLGPSILVVDDDPNFAAAVKMMLEAEGYQVVTTCNGPEALACLQEEHPDLVLLDIVMESLAEGWEVVQAVRMEAQQQGISILALSPDPALDRTGELVPRGRLFFDDVVKKPVEPAILLERVQGLLSQG